MRKSISEIAHHLGFEYDNRILKLPSNHMLTRHTQNHRNLKVNEKLNVNNWEEAKVFVYELQWMDFICICLKKTSTTETLLHEPITLRS